MIEIIPAIDIIAGRCVRLTQGRYDEETVFSDNPVEMAVKWQAEGAKRLHLVDLDGARAGEPQNIETVIRICQAVSIPAQMGGGVRSIQTARQVLEAGVDRVIIGTSAAVRSGEAEAMFRELGERAILSVDSKHGRVAISGWQSETEERAVEFARRMQLAGVRRMIFTDISRDGVLAGVDIPVFELMVKAVDVPVIAAGGVTTVEDISALKALGPWGLEGAIIGKALYTGAIKLADALAAAQ